MITHHYACRLRAAVSRTTLPSSMLTRRSQLQEERVPRQVLPAVELVPVAVELLAQTHLAREEEQQQQPMPAPAAAPPLGHSSGLALLSLHPLKPLSQHQGHRVLADLPQLAPREVGLLLEGAQRLAVQHLPRVVRVVV
jgi:hypothetical protein